MADLLKSGNYVVEMTIRRTISVDANDPYIWGQEWLFNNLRGVPKPGDVIHASVQKVNPPETSKLDEVLNDAAARVAEWPEWRKSPELREVYPDNLLNPKVVVDLAATIRAAKTTAETSNLKG